MAQRRDAESERLVLQKLTKLARIRSSTASRGLPSPILQDPVRIRAGPGWHVVLRRVAGGGGQGSGED